MEKKDLKIGLLGSCQLHLCSTFFFNEEVLIKNNFKILFSLPFYEYDINYASYKGILNYKIFDDLDCLIIEINNLDNQASSIKIIDYCSNKNIKIIKTFMIKFPIYPINWSGYGENKNDYLNWNNLDNIDYKDKFKKCILSCKKSNEESDLSIEITEFIDNNFNKKLLFTHSLHPTNILLFELWRCIFDNLSINIYNYNFIFNKELINCWYNPFTSKMIKDLNIEFETIVDDIFYINRYNQNILILKEKYLDNINEKYLDNINEKYPYLILKYYKNINIYLTLPIEIDKRETVFFQNFYSYENNYVNNHINNIIELNKNNIYVVLTNIYNHHFYHTLQEFIIDLEIYLLYFKNYKIICFDNDYNSYYFKLAREYFNILDENILVINRDNQNIYNGNFLYLHLYPKYKDNYNLIFNNIPSLHYKYKYIQSRKYLNCYNNLSYKDSKWINKEERIIVNRFIEEAYKKYGNDKTIQLYDRIWISRRNLNIHTYKHKRFIKNINDIVPILETNNFIELFFEDNLYDILKQIYIINNASVIFTEMGTAFCNINFMKPNTKFITTNYHEIPCLEEIANNICDYNNVNFHIYNDIEIDTENEYYSLAKECIICPNLPIKITDINNFNIWFDDLINNK